MVGSCGSDHFSKVGRLEGFVDVIQRVGADCRGDTGTVGVIGEYPVEDPGC